MNTDEQQDKAIDRLLDKVQRFCAYQERCTQEIHRKLRSLGANQYQTNQIANILEQQGFLNDRRFAKVYAHGKFSNNNWGKIRISMELKRRNISDAIIGEALEEIDEPSYIKAMKQLIEQKIQALQERHSDLIPEKTAAYCQQKGFEADLVWPFIHQILSKSKSKHSS